MSRSHIEVAEILLCLLVTLSSHPNESGISPASCLAEKIAEGFVAVGVDDLCGGVDRSRDGAKRIHQVVGSDSIGGLADDASIHCIVVGHCPEMRSV